MFQNSDCFIENANNYIEIKNVNSPEAFETVLNYMYTGEIEIDSKNFQEIVQLSCLFQLSELIKYCKEFLIQNLSTSNCIGYLCLSDFYALNPVPFVAKRFIENNFAEIIREEEFLELPANLFKSFLRSENLSINSEYQVLASTIRWIQHKPQERLEFLKEFIDIIRMPTIPKSSIENLMKKCNDTKIYDILKNHIKQQILASDPTIDHQAHNNSYDSIRCKPRMASRRTIYLFGGQSLIDSSRNRSETLSLVEKFSSHIGKWEIASPLMYQRSNHCAVLLNDKIYIIGGICDSLVLESMEIYDPSCDQISLASNLKTPRSEFGACAHETFIYAFGGRGDGAITIEQYDPNMNTWQIFDKMPFSRHAMQVIEHDGLIFLIGGANKDNSPQASVFLYDPQRKTFSRLASLNNPRKSFAATVMHSFIYVFGGIGASDQTLRSVEQYNIKADKWSIVSEMPVAQSNMCAASIHDLIYVYGGLLNNRQHNRLGKIVHVYDPSLDQWLTTKPMTKGRKDAAVIII
ncbi:actin-binding protein ipp-like protein [Sarcoptes scabiei]|nr:actin-binding protein ipp-like protein [Sarcoptes scabiei]